MKKRLMAGLLAAVMLLTLLSGGALAAGEPNERLAYTASKYADAKGTSSNGKTEAMCIWTGSGDGQIYVALLANYSKMAKDPNGWTLFYKNGKTYARQDGGLLQADECRC